MPRLSNPHCRTLTKLAAVALFVLATGGPTVIAAPDPDSSRFWFLTPQPRVVRTPGPVVQRPKPHFVREQRAAPEPARRRYRIPVTRNPAVAPTVQPALPADAGSPFGPPLPPQPAAPAPQPDAPPADMARPAPAPVPAPVSPSPDSPPPIPAPVIAAPQPTAQPDKPVELSFFITVIGDNLGQLLAQGLQESLADKPQVQVRRKARESSGLVRDDFYDWLKVARDLTGGQDRERIDFAVIMIGSNDRQALRDGATSAEVRSDRWKEIYGQRVEDLAAIFRDRKIPLVWVGLPVMRSERLSADILYFNEIYRDRATKAGAIYADTWEAFVDDKGQYDPYGPDVSGQTVKLRTGDGVHFTKAGSLKLAHFAEGDIRRAITGAKPPAELAVLPPQGGGPTVAVPAAPGDAVPATAGTPTAATQAPLVLPLTQPRRDPDRDPAGSIQASLPPPDFPAELSFPLKPAAGPVVSLTAPPLSVGGQLATRGKRLVSPLGADSQAALDRAFVEGRPIEAKPGRADDFAWPRR